MDTNLVWSAGTATPYQCFCDEPPLNSLPVDIISDHLCISVVFPDTTNPAQPSQESAADPTHAFTESLSLFTTETPETSNPQNPPAMIDGVQIPEGVDPSFLEALPEAIRREVLAKQLALRRTPATAVAPSTSSGGDTSGTLNVSPEFLAALPPEVQDEVLFNSTIYVAMLQMTIFAGTRSI